MKKIIFLLLISYVSPLWGDSLPLEHFASLPDVALMSLSPDGEKVSSTVRVDMNNTKGTAVQVSNLKTGEKNIVLFTDDKKYILNWVRWKDNQTLLIGTFYPAERDTWLGMRQARYKTRETRLLIVDVKSGEVRTPLKTSYLKKFKILPTGLARVLDTLPDDPDHILMELPTNQSFVTRSFTGVYQVNIKNQNMRVVQKSMDHVQSWLTDQQHRVRVGFYYDYETGINKTLVKTLPDEKWVELWPYEIFSEDSVVPIGFGLDPNILYVRAYLDKRLAIFKVNLKDKNFKRELVYADPDYDVNGGLVYSPKSKDVVGISYSADGGFTFFDPEFKKLQAGIDKALPSTRNYVVSLSQDEQGYLVFSSSDTDSGSYYLGQRSPAKLDAIAYRYKHLTPELMAPVKRYDYKARDGLAIEAYLTLPKASNGKNLPTIIFPHGGPISRDDDSFDYWTQYLANKGYAVLQMNFRGSSGRGLDFRNAGLKNWGMEMQDDIEDGARKLIADGISDKNSICILGASYGGYAALMGAVKTPDLYKCSVSVAGVSNVFELVKDNRAFWSGYNVVDEQIGNDNKQLRAISPVNHADKIKIPILLIHGDNDRQVDIKHSIQMRDALQKHGKDVSFLELPNEDHYLTNNENRVATFQKIDAFLNQHLAVKPQQKKQMQ